MAKKTILAVGIFMLGFMWLAGNTFGRTVTNPTDYKGYQGGGSAVNPPAHGIAAHRVGQLELAINNNGTFGTGFTVGPKIDYFTGFSVPSCEYPKGSHVQYLFAAAFWIGAVVGRDTLVSVGADGWNPSGRELLPDEEPFGQMIKRSIIDPAKPEYEGAISEEDYICTYSDTYTEGIQPDVVSQRPHRPLHVKVTEASYAWSYSYAEDLVLFDYRITNIGVEKITNAYMGIYVDADVCFDCTGTSGYADDICGFLHTYPAYCQDCEYIDTVNIAWISDNDGDFGFLQQAPHVTATRVVRTPAERLDVSFNWWISNSASSKDFGPREKSGKGRWQEDFRDFGGFLGTPEGDANKYYTLRNQEFDYDQAFTATIQESDTLWLFPGEEAGLFATGYDTRYLLSFGPFNINPGDQLPISFAYLAGPNFHKTRGNIDNLPENPDLFYANLNFADLGENARWASWIYDNPGVDTDSNGYQGEPFVCVADSAVIDSTLIPNTDPPEWEYLYEPTLADTCWIIGDGVPDFRGASPPPAPVLWLEPREGALRVRFNGFRSETTKDVFSGIVDFEGYRVYLARDERSQSYSVVASYDLENFNKWVWNPRRIGGPGYEMRENPFTREQLECLYGDSCGDHNFNPLGYSHTSPYIPPGFPDSMFYFVPQDYNAAELGIATPIRKIYPDQEYPSTLIPEEAAPGELTEDGYFKYFEYELIIRDLLPTVPYWLNVTAFDFGSPSSGLESLETSVTVGSKCAYPHASAAEAEGQKLAVYVYPNPYRVDDDYKLDGFEGRNDFDKHRDRVREIHFVNVPARCVIRIHSLDGDLVREIKHNARSDDPLASHASWDLITRNTQLVVSGIYYWTVEDANGEVQIGKLVVIM
ncbi:MAG: hypothetical protein OEW00_03930 [candidate division Zixibacteria bacterium]|nr:hypothetical protein [candidate division Zixibacteria bacterium]